MNLDVAKARNRYTNFSGSTVKDSARKSAREDRGRNGSVTQMMHHSNSNIEQGDLGANIAHSSANLIQYKPQQLRGEASS